MKGQHFEHVNVFHSIKHEWFRQLGFALSLFSYCLSSTGQLLDSLQDERQEAGCLSPHPLRLHRGRSCQRQRNKKGEEEGETGWLSLVSMGSNDTFSSHIPNTVLRPVFNQNQKHLRNLPNTIMYRMGTAVQRCPTTYTGLKVIPHCAGFLAYGCFRFTKKLLRMAIPFFWWIILTILLLQQLGYDSLNTNKANRMHYGSNSKVTIRTI